MQHCLLAHDGYVVEVVTLPIQPLREPAITRPGPEMRDGDYSDAARLEHLIVFFDHRARIVKMLDYADAIDHIERAGLEGGIHKIFFSYICGRVRGGKKL